eukprot:CAMPEP_0178390150 /NCGR_PEP_ID=MMETSP0689_2-20121128/10496_1 /TAXON_ID=160604 /ORGANISM="Amphidinium massartii, Strain CS-259" /LENGTH=276 /DNA_ID=CAMNT_0020010647 /DNA_START=93 /DNA_END=920 /DNA_ORIENTATION=+
MAAPPLAARQAALRTILRECRLLGPRWVPRAPADFLLWGRGFFVDPNKPNQRLMSLVPNCFAPAIRPPLNPSVLSWVRARLRAGVLGCPQELADEAAAVVENIDAVKTFLRGQCTLSSCSSISEEHGLRVEAVSGLAQDGGGTEKGYVFTYNIRFTNVGPHRLRVIARQYNFRDAHGRLRSIIRADQLEAAGVVGFTPLLPPGSSFEFGSGVMLPTPQGCLTGGFSVIREPAIDEDAAALHQQIESAELMIRYAYYKDLAEVVHVPLGQLRFDADV